jgi:hypothetical protein
MIDLQIEALVAGSIVVSAVVVSVVGRLVVEAGRVLRARRDSARFRAMVRARRGPADGWSDDRVPAARDGGGPWGR